MWNEGFDVESVEDFSSWKIFLGYALFETGTKGLKMKCALELVHLNNNQCCHEIVFHLCVPFSLVTLPFNFFFFFFKKYFDCNNSRIF